MSRTTRLVLLAAVTATVAAPLALPARAALEVPTSGCFDVVDTVADVSDPDLDVLGLTMRTTPSSLRAYVRTRTLAAGPRSTDAHRFSVAFSYRDTRFTLEASASQRGSDRLRDGATGVLVGGRTQLSVGSGPLARRASGLTATFDTAHSLVVLDLPVRDITAYGGSGWGTGAGAAVNNLAVTSANDVGVTTYGGDSAGFRGDNYRVGDNRCFGPPPAVLSVLSGTQSQYGDLVGVTARLTDASGKALARRSVRVDLAGSSTTATTGSDGLLRASLSPGVVAGSYPLTLTWDGDTTAGRASVSRAYTVVAETTRLSLSTRTKRGDRSVTATLKDDDGTPLAGASLSVRVGSSTTTLLTSAKGVAEVHDLPSGTDVTVTYAGVSGKWLGTSASTRTGGNRGGDDD